jgi:hypothetical protein
VQGVWKRDRRAESSEPGEALKRAAQAAQILNQAFGSLSKSDLGWVENLLNQEPSWSQERLLGQEPMFQSVLPPFQDRLRELSATLWLIHCLFSAAVGEVPPPLPGTAKLPNKPGRKRGTVDDITFQGFVQDLLTFVAEAGGELTFDKNFKKGTLIEALDVLRPHLPNDVIPYDPPSGTLQRIKTKHSKARRLWLKGSAK